MSAEAIFKRMRSADDEAASPKYAHIELERRWLVDPVKSAEQQTTDPITIRDLYITGTRLRLREMRSGEDRVFKLTKKYPCEDPAARPIVTAYLDAAEYRLFAALPGCWIEKTRFKLVERGIAYSLDRFGGALAGLELAEIEASDHPSLLGIPAPSCALREITDAPEYQGGNLAIYGLPKE